MRLIGAARAVTRVLPVLGWVMAALSAGGVVIGRWVWGDVAPLLNTLTVLIMTMGRCGNWIHAHAVANYSTWDEAGPFRSFVRCHSTYPLSTGRDRANRCWVLCIRSWHQVIHCLRVSPRSSRSMGSHRQTEDPEVAGASFLFLMGRGRPEHRTWCDNGGGGLIHTPSMTPESTVDTSPRRVFTPFRS
jgi:hypothetical protein